MVVVFGSINLDLLARVARFAAPGETLAGESFATYPGGKGANQALAAARAGAEVRLVGAVGEDAFAAPALALAKAGGVDTTRVRAIAGATGVALIQVTPAGENAIVVVAGANALADPRDVPDAWLVPATTVVLQNEVPAAANASIAARARRAGSRVVWNAAPARAGDEAMLALASVLVVNETELRAIADEHALPDAPAAFVRAAAQRHSVLVVATLGAAGAIAADVEHAHSVAAPRIDVVDSTGAGDAFVGALAAALDGGSALRDALPFATAAGSLACTRAGAQPSMPHAEEIAAIAATLVVDG